MDAHTFATRSETFGFDTPRPWSAEALRLLFNTPRAYEPLVKAWDKHYPGTVKALWRLQRLGFVAYQGPVIMNTRTGEMADSPSRAVARFRTTAKGRRLLDEAAEDLRILEDTFPQTSPANLAGVVRLLDLFDLDGSHARFGLSMAHGVELSGLAERSGRWWVKRLVELRYLRELPEQWADTREVIPAHFRVTRQLTRQLSDVVEAFGMQALKAEFRLQRSRFLDDVDPARLGISGATDFDHDVEAQRLLAAMILSPRCEADGRISVEPRYFLPLTPGRDRSFFDPDGDGSLYYQPDAELRERDDQRRLHRSIFEYERYQSRRDAWNHIERFLGYLHTRTLPFEPAVLRFVVDTPSRVRSYVALIEAFADHLLDHPEQAPGNEVILAVTSAEAVLRAVDPLEPRNWHRLTLPQGGADTERRPVLHDRDSSPYDEYFART